MPVVKAQSSFTVAALSGRFLEIKVNIRCSVKYCLKVDRDGDPWWPISNRGRCAGLRHQRDEYIFKMCSIKQEG